MRDLVVGAIFAGYRIEGLAGRGGMGVVYRARHLRLDRVDALKLIAPEFAEDPVFRARFERESRVAAGIDHPHVITIYYAGEEDGRLYLAMRYVEGTDLRAELQRCGRFEPGRAAAIIDQTASALDAAHARGLVHRDVKPANVLVSEQAGREHVYLTDFGLTKHLESRGGETGTGRFVGTTDYIAPEQVMGRPLDARTDVYSLGCVLYHLLSGRVPYPMGHEMATAMAHVNDPPPSLSALRPELSQRFDPVIGKAMAKNPAHRYRSAGEMASAASAAAGVGAPSDTKTWVEHGPTIVDVKPPRRRRSRRRLLYSGLAAAAVLAVAAAATLSPGTAKNHSSSTGTGTAKQPPKKPTTGWPDGATAAAVLAPVRDGINQCASIPEVTPRDCVQPSDVKDSIGDQVSGDTGPFVWKLYGDPTRGALASYRGSDQFVVTGAYAMTIGYTVNGFRKLALVAHAFRATVAWHPGTRAASVQVFAPADTGPNLPQPTGDWRASAIAVTREMLNTCAASTTAGTAGCPQQERTGLFNPSDFTSVRYRIVGDPLRAASVSYDPPTGVIHVTGQIDMKMVVVLSVSGAPDTFDAGGTYDASLVPTSTGLEPVLVSES